MSRGRAKPLVFILSFIFSFFFTPPLCTKNTAANLLRQGRSTVSAVPLSSLPSWRGLWRAQKILNKGKKHCTSLRRWCFLIANPLPCPPPSSALVISVLRPSHNQTGAFWGLNFGCFFPPCILPAGRGLAWCSGPPSLPRTSFFSQFQPRGTLLVHLESSWSTRRCSCPPRAPSALPEEHVLRQKTSKKKTKNLQKKTKSLLGELGGSRWKRGACFLAFLECLWEEDALRHARLCARIPLQGLGELPGSAPACCSLLSCPG